MRRSVLVAAAAALVVAVPAVPRAEDAPASAPGASAAPAEPVVVVVTRSGAAFRGVVVKRDERMLHLRSSSGAVRELPLASVVRIEDAADHDATAARKAALREQDAAASSAAEATHEAGTQEGSHPGGVLAGVGVAIPASDSRSGSAAILFFPLQLSRGLRLEPEVGFESGESRTDFVVGLGLFATRLVAPQVRGYVGPRVEVARPDDDDTSFGFGLALGGEYLPVPRVALGAEARVGITTNAWFERDSLSSGTGALLFVRVFLN